MSHASTHPTGEGIHVYFQQFLTESCAFQILLPDPYPKFLNFGFVKSKLVSKRIHNIFHQQAMSSGASWEANRTPAQALRRREAKVVRSMAHQMDLEWRGPVEVGPSGPDMVGQGCSSCDYRNHQAIKCQGHPKMCLPCCRRRGICSWHSLHSADLEKARKLQQ
jgi:hypothetical protein